MSSKICEGCRYPITLCACPPYRKRPQGEPGREIGAYEKLGMQIGELVDRKQVQYGDAITAVGKHLQILFPNGIKPEQYENMGIIVRILDKLNRVANGDQGEESAWHDVAGYGLLGAMNKGEIE